MHAVRQSMRPKHQVLVLKCYPRYQKNVADVKPNSSELSYLLYYASTRRSKIQKVGAFLEKKTSSDVWRGKVGNVQVTLQIIRSMIDKSPRDLPLYAPYVLRILAMVLKSKDIGMVEDSVPTLQTFCQHQDLATLTADQELVKQYEEIVKSYAEFASKPQGTSKHPLSTPIAIRWKTAGLKALKSISASEGVGADGGRQLSIIVPVILENLYSNRHDILLSLYQKVGVEKDGSTRRRMSVNTMQTADQRRNSTQQVSETTADADRLAEEEAALLALQSLKQIFSANNRVQIRLAITNMLKFFMNKSLIARPETATSTKSKPQTDWPTSLTEMVTRWTPVQDRFIIVVTTMETLVRSPTTEDNMSNQLVLGRLVQWLLGSTINMIGLSVMDILLGLIQHVLILLQLGGRGTNVLPHHQQTDAIDLFKENQRTSDKPTHDISLDVLEDPTSTPSAARQELLVCLQKCIANLATHIYYGDQISDILTAILLRLKPSPTPGLASAAAAIERPAAAAQAISDSVNMREDHRANEFFSFGTARVTALNAVKEVLTIANKNGATVGAGAVGRNRVGVRVWEGTQWLLRDEDRRVRRAYVDALLTWMHLELNKKDLRIMEEKPKSKNKKLLGEEELKRTNSIARVASNASRGSRAKPLKTTFLHLLHLAVYDNALEEPENNSDILLMNLVLTSLVERLGVNALKSGLPVMVRLQEDINTTLATPKAKVNVGSLVHGYFLCLTKIFEFDTTLPGYEIQSEISRRKKAGLWMDRLQFPSLALEHLIVSSPVSGLSAETSVQHESLKPFDNIAAMVNQISIAYSDSISSAPSSPPQSPARGLSSPITSSVVLRTPAGELPVAFREVMLSKWSKEACIASIEKDSARTVSPHGSRSGTTHSNQHNGLLAANGHNSRDVSPAGAILEANSAVPKGPASNVAIKTSQLRRSSAQSSIPPSPGSSADHKHTIRVDDLKRVLAGGSLADVLHNKKSQRNGSPLRNSSTVYQDFGNDTNNLDRRNTRPSILSSGSDSVVDAEGFESASEGDPEHPLPTPQTPITSKEIAEQYMQQLGRRSYEQEGTNKSRPDSRDNRPPSRMSRPRSSSSASAEDPEANAKALKGELFPSVVRGSIVGDEGVPPVPPLPEGIVASMPTSPRLQTPTAAATSANNPDKVVGPTGLDGGAVGSTPAAVVPPAAPPTVSSTAPSRERSLDRISVEKRRSLPSRSRLKPDSARDRRTMVQSLLGSIEVKVDSSGVGGKGGGLGRPPY